VYGILAAAAVACFFLGILISRCAPIELKEEACQEVCVDTFIADLAPGLYMIHQDSLIVASLHIFESGIVEFSVEDGKHIMLIREE
jgi:hypothetical protein